MTEGTVPEDRLAAFVAGLRYDDLPKEIATFVERRFVDTIGVTVAGGRTNACEAVVESLYPDGDGLDDAQPGDYGFLFGTMGHSLDYDDSTHSAHAHFSVSLISTVLALATRYSVDGRDAVVAYTAGYESAYYLAEMTMDDHYQQGWHATSTLGTYAATAAAATILGLDETETRHALNLCSSMPSGLRCNFGTTTKPIHAGHATRAGITAATLASNGATASEGAISGTYGFMEVYTDDGGDVSEGTLEEDWAILDEGVNTKKYPCCHASHAAIEAMITLVSEHDIDPGTIEKVDVTTSALAGQNLQYVTPTNGLEAKFSMHYPVACAIEHEAVTVEMFDDENVVDSAVVRHIDQITHSVDSELPYRYETEVVIRTTAGETYEQYIKRPPGMEGPLSEQATRAKFLDCTSMLSPERREALFEALDSVRRLSTLDDIVETVLDAAL